MSAASTTASRPLPPFVLRHLDAIAQAERLTDYTVEHGAGSKHGDGFMSNMLAISLVTRDRRLPLICKLQLAQPQPPKEATTAAAVAAVLDPVLYFQREVHMYTHVLPRLEQLQRTHGLTPASGFFSYPRCYLAEMASDHESIIILEDLRARRFQLWDKLQPMPVQAVRLLLQQLGRLAGVSFVLRDQQPEAFAELERLDDHLIDTLVKVESMSGIFDSALVQAQRLIEGERDLALLSKFAASWKQLAATRRAPERLGRFGVLVHSDCHINNMMFALDPADGVPAEMVLIDWQTSLVGSPVTDVVNFLWWCTEKRLRDEHWAELLDVYHGEVQRVIRACGSDADALFSRGDFEAQMREYSVNAVATAAAAVSYMITDPKDLQSLATLAEAAEDDVNGKMLAPLTKASEQKFRERLLDVLNDARRMGYLERFEE